MISRYPHPIKWTTDCGTDNLGAFASLCKSLGILHITTAVFNPTANGGAERLVGTIKHMLQRLVGTHLESWPRMLRHACGADMRHRVHSVTGVSLMEMALGIGDPAIPPLSPRLSSPRMHPSSRVPPMQFLPAISRRAEFLTLTPSRRELFPPPFRISYNSCPI